MKTLVFANRNCKELLRDPISVIFSLGFPVGLLLLMTAIQANIPVPLFEIERLTPGIAVFGLSFIALFSANLISHDRANAFLTRLFTAPLSSFHFILGYVGPLFPLALGQMIVCMLTAVILKLPVSVRLPALLAVEFPAALLYISIGLLCGSLFSDKQIGGLCGALLTNMTAILSGAWFDLNMIGGTFQKAANLLPFVHAVDMGRAVLAGNWTGIFPYFWIVLGWAVILMAAAILAFRGKMHT